MASKVISSFHLMENDMWIPKTDVKLSNVYAFDITYDLTDYSR